MEKKNPELSLSNRHPALYVGNFFQDRLPSYWTRQDIVTAPYHAAEHGKKCKSHLKCMELLDVVHSWGAIFPVGIVGHILSTLLLLLTVRKFHEI